MRKIFLTTASALLVAGCSSFGGGSGKTSSDPSAMTKLANLIAFNSTTAPKPIDGVVSTNSDYVECPVVDVEDGGGVAQIGSGTNLRHQFTISDTARECSVANKQISIRVGVAGRVIAGPAGGPGTVSVPVRIGIRRETDKTIITSKVVNITATIPSGAANATFAVVSDPLVVPWLREEADEDYMVMVSLAKR